MTIKIIELTDDQIQETEANFPQSQPKRFQVKEGNGTLVYCDTKEEAEREIKEWNARDDLRDNISEFIDGMLDKYGSLLEDEEIRSMLKEY